MIGQKPRDVQFPLGQQQVEQLVPLRQPHVARGGAPVLTSVDARIFTHRYFARCLACDFCRDACCDHGVDADGATVDRILAAADELEPIVGSTRDQWFDDKVDVDPDMPGGSSRRTKVRDGACVFRDRSGRGCLLHRAALTLGRDYHELKPMVSTLFPVTFHQQELLISDELEDGSLVCGGCGPTAYEAVRDELGYYFGDALVAELDDLAARVIAH